MASTNVSDRRVFAAALLNRLFLYLVYLLLRERSYKSEGSYLRHSDKIGDNKGASIILAVKVPKESITIPWDTGRKRYICPRHRMHISLKSVITRIPRIIRSHRLFSNFYQGVLHNFRSDIYIYIFLRRV